MERKIENFGGTFSNFDLHTKEMGTFSNLDYLNLKFVKKMIIKFQFAEEGANTFFHLKFLIASEE